MDQRERDRLLGRGLPATLLFVLACMPLTGCGEKAARAEVALQAAVQPTEEAPLSYNRDIRPILSDKCFACHGPDAGSREAELRLDVIEDGEDYFGAYLAIEPGDPDASELIKRIHHKKAKFVMPPTKFGVPLTADEKSLLGRWIKQGAKYEGHWAFEPVKQVAVPDVEMGAWAHNEIDKYILARLEADGIEPAPAAAFHTRIRRAALDLTGLPPEPSRVVELVMLVVEDPAKADKVYEAYVDELLASPHFGERWATIWLDAARYADTNGYLHDHRRTMWPWRDWVVKAYNDNMPYDVFLRDQVAGDLLPNATDAQIVATAFNRNHALTTEGGSIDEEFRVEYAADRTNTLGAAVLALTMECARCHDHKYDPISQEDYFSLFAYFNSLDSEKPVEKGRAGAFPPLIRDETTGQQVMIMREAAEPRPTYVLDRGQYDAPLKDRPVSRRVPSALGVVPEDASADRLGLAKWLTDADNPLTARVEVNRIWQTLFGIGLVKTSEDFGLQGEWPSHPELLDYLAKRFIDSGWDRKALIRLIVTSATYQQSSHARPELEASDPENRLLARMSRLRLPAEMIRDQALASSGLLVNKLGGEGVRPYQPPGLWREGGNQSSNTRVFRLGKGEELYRRSIYTFWKRTAPPPQMALFDAADRNACALRRSTTNTALQALLLMNDEQHLEAARALAARAWRADKDDAQRLNGVYLCVLGRPARDKEAKVLLEGIHHYRVVYKADNAAAQSLLKAGQSALPNDIEAGELAAWTMIASTVLNLDETVTRP